MPYAVPQDLVDSFGEAELIRLTTPDGRDMVDVDLPRVARAIAQVSGTMDSYLRRRYAIPVPPSPELLACCVAMARYELQFSGSTQPTEQARLAHKTKIEWLEHIAAGRVTLDGAVPAGPLSGAKVSQRPPVFCSGGRL